MVNETMLAIPQGALRKLEFLSGDYSGVQTLYPPGGDVVSYNVSCCIAREACDRFVRIEFFGEVPELGVETFTAMVTFSAADSCYKMWLFSSRSEEPLHMKGELRDHGLVMISQPWVMPWGLQRLRSTFVPYIDGSFELLTELWSPDGYVKFRQTLFRRRALAL
ncbi:MAG TPA: hypothetical protein VMI31_05810 [Fimbriimonadaceae bacterium]|nr:hypothetical protein [Fimbriimonadaceae bacterium]